VLIAESDYNGYVEPDIDLVDQLSRSSIARVDILSSLPRDRLILGGANHILHIAIGRPLY
jgi:hypothetical protein